MSGVARITAIALVLSAWCGALAVAREPESFDVLSDRFAKQMRPLLAAYCLDCHSTDQQEGELDLERFATLADVRRDPPAWQKVREMLGQGEMPPDDAEQPSADKAQQLRDWVAEYLRAEALAAAGDPGPVSLRRLNNAELNYTVLDLTGVDLRPSREFPADGAAGEGFTNAGQALSMSPALLAKYLDAAKSLAAHAVFLPDGLRFSAGTTRRDWSDELLAQIKTLYARYADAEGRLPLEAYLSATLEERNPLAAGDKTVAEVAAARHLNERYLSTIWQMMTSEVEPSMLLGSIRRSWQKSAPTDVGALAGEIRTWQQALTRFQNVGHMKQWVVAVDPLTTAQDVRLAIPADMAGEEITVYLAATEAGDGATGDAVVWQNPRLVAPGRADLPLRDVRRVVRKLEARRARLIATTSKCLDAVAAATAMSGSIDVEQLATAHEVDARDLAAWLDYLGLGSEATAQLEYLKGRIETSAGYDFVQGWGSGDTPSLVANSSDQHVRIPGNAKPHGVMVHPSPTTNIAAGWRSPIAGAVRVEAVVTHAHPVCGNGVAWSVEHRRGRTRRTLASGVSAGGQPVAVGPIERLAVREGDLVSLVVGPRDGNHACDLTDVELKLTGDGDDPAQWSLTADVSPDVSAGNPHADRQGHDAVWHFYTEPTSGAPNGPIVPDDSILARWQATDDSAAKHALAVELQTLLTNGPPDVAQQPDAALYRQIVSLGGPLLAGARAIPRTDGVVAESISESSDSESADSDAWGFDPELFGRHPDGEPLAAADLFVQAPSVVAVRLPVELVAGCELVARGALDSTKGQEGSVQLLVATAGPGDLAALRVGVPILVGEQGARRAEIERATGEFRAMFPAALCYNRIVPVDEVVTLTLFHREDEPLARLMLDDEQRAELDRLWDELHFVSHDALAIVDAFQQLMEYATQDSDPGLFEPFRRPIHDRAAGFRQQLLDAEPQHVVAVLTFAEQAYRRPLSEAEQDELRRLYRTLRDEELSHDEAIRLLLARVFVAPAFLYRLEDAPPGEKPGDVSDYELASRLSYFLWSSSPEGELLDCAGAGRLRESDVLTEQTRRMLADPRVRRLATEFACQWIHVYDFDTLDEKSERHFPEFVELRDDMYEEAILFFADLFQRDGSILDVLDADHTFVNEALARHYGIPGVTGDEWRRIDGVRQYARGGIFGFAATLAKQSAASRTSPTLRGNWVSEVLLGEKLPKPPPNVPVLPEDEAALEGLTVRQLVEKHSSDPRCASCHKRVDPIGFALEEFDAIGRHRTVDLGERPIDVHTTLQDGTEIVGQEGLRDYLLHARRDAFLRQFCRKLVGYALGRGVQLSDEPLLTTIQQRLENEGYRFSVAVDSIVQSPQFRQIRGRDFSVAEATAGEQEQSD